MKRGAGGFKSPALHDMAQALRQPQGYTAVSGSGWDNLQDEELLRRIQEGSQHAFSVLVRRHAERFYRVAYRFMANREEAEDSVQDAFLKLWERPEIWKEGQGAMFTTWFHRIVVNGCLDRRKRKKPLPLAEGFDVADSAESQDEGMARREEQVMLEREIAALPERQQVALNLCVYEGLSNQEAADVMGLKLKALQSLLMRAKTTLKERMKEYV